MWPSLPHISLRKGLDPLLLAWRHFQDSAPAEIKELAMKLGLSPESALPKSRKQHQAIEKTARFVCEKGEKMEANLKVQADISSLMYRKDMCACVRARIYTRYGTVSWKLEISCLYTCVSIPVRKYSSFWFARISCMLV
jgi:hypothetical protein